jgi:hypothetical protein
MTTIAQMGSLEAAGVLIAVRLVGLQYRSRAQNLEGFSKSGKYLPDSRRNGSGFGKLQLSKSKVAWQNGGAELWFKNHT